MKKEFEHELSQQGFVYQETSEGYYNITPKNRIVLPTKIQLVISKPINLIIHGSQNFHELSAIGYFNFSLSKESIPNIMIFAFRDLNYDTSHYMIISTDELRERMKKNIIRYRNGVNLELRLWLLDDHLYDTTYLGLEGEYYYLSEGRGGRMIDGTIWNYTRFLNNWVLGSRK